MAKQLFSSSWYRVADLRLRLRGHVEIHQQRHRGVIWRIIEDPQSGRFHRLTPAAYFLVCMMDGRRSMQDLWALLERRFGADLPTQDDILRFLGQLHAADLLVGDTLPDLNELGRRAEKLARQQLMARVKNPLALRFPLLDPDPFITATMRYVRPLFSPIGGALWLALVLTGIGVAAVNWSELTGNLSDRVLSQQNLLLLIIIYPLVKGIHELGHAYAVKRWGGSIHELGLMLLVFMPLPYVEASASLAFRAWWKRAIVAGAGMLVELALAAIAVIAWSLLEPGFLRAAMFNVALIGGVSTVLFNGNPLLRFDGYYVLCDVIGVPNLGMRANKYLGYLVQTHGFGREAMESPVVTPSERKWLVGYALAAFLYRLFIAAIIAAFVATKFFVVGVLLAILVLLNMVIWPLLKGAAFVLTSPLLDRCRNRAFSVTGATLALVLALVLAVPLPHATIAQGVVSVPEGAEIRSKVDGAVVEILAPSGARVAAGDPLLRLQDPFLEAQLQLQEVYVRELQLRRDAIYFQSPADAELLRAEVARASQELARLTRDVADLTVRAGRTGIWWPSQADDLVGRFVLRGTSLGLVSRPDDRVLRAVVGQAAIDSVRQDTQAVEVRLAHARETALPAELTAEIPQSARLLPSRALSSQGGGPFPLDPNSPDVPRALDPVFQFELSLLDGENIPSLYPGERVHLRFDHGTEPLGPRIYRAARRAFLRQLNV